MVNLAQEQVDQMNAEQKAKKSAVLMLNRDEGKVSQFFSAVATQYFLHKDMLINKLTAPNFMFTFAETELCATQRSFIREIISNEKYKKVMEEMQALYMEYCNETGRKSPPASIFLSRINKAFLIRQIYGHGENGGEKYAFIDNFLNIGAVDVDALHNKMWSLPVEHQIIILSRILDEITDDIEDKKKTLINSYKENLHRLTVDIKQHPNKHINIHGGNLEAFKKGLHEYDVETAQKLAEAEKIKN